MAKGAKSKKKSDPSLKSQNRIRLATVIGANFGVLATLIATSKLALPSLSQGTHLLSAVTQAGLGAIVAGLLSDQFSPNTKAQIVYWRWKHPLPGARAFSGVGPADVRVDMQSLETKHAPLPTDPDQQNKLWYKIYKNNETAGSVVDANKQYLFYRDYTAVALLFLVTLPTIAAFKVRPWETVLVYAAIMAAQYLLVRRAAVLNGHRLVANVLAEAC